MASGFGLCVLALFLLAIPPSLGFSQNDYGDALTKSILFYEGMRSGPLPRNQRLTWRGDSGMQDGEPQKVNLTGGYYDSGDNVKFGLPMAFTSTLLAWSILEYNRELHQAGQQRYARSAVRWTTDYFLKAWQPPSTLWAQVGNPWTDHICWQRPEDMTTPRDAYQVNAENPGSDVAGETAAALASASIIYRRTNPEYSKQMLTAAIELFEFADKYRGSYSDSLSSVVNPFYKSFSGYNDELLWAATWLHLATKDPKYLEYIIDQKSTNPGINPLSWDNKYAGVFILMSKLLFKNNDKRLQIYKTRADQFICSIMPGGGRMTPAGLYYYGGNNLQYVTSNAFLLITYARYLDERNVECGRYVFTPKQLISQARNQIDYILGNNPNKMSYMVGFGNNYPLRVHHRGASLPSIKIEDIEIGCKEGFSWLHNGEPNPNVLEGALPGGPDAWDDFSDNRDRSVQTEASTYTNSGLVGALAYLAHHS